MDRSRAGTGSESGAPHTEAFGLKKNPKTTRKAYIPMSFLWPVKSMQHHQTLNASRTGEPSDIIRIIKRIINRTRTENNKSTSREKTNHPRTSGWRMYINLNNLIIDWWISNLSAFEILDGAKLSSEPEAASALLTEASVADTEDHGRRMVSKVGVAKT